MKVKLNKNVSSCLIGSKEYKRGEVFEVAPEQFVSHIMTEIAEPVAVEAPPVATEESAIKPVAEEDAEVAAEPEEEKPKKRVRKKKAEAEQESASTSTSEAS